MIDWQPMETAPKDGTRVIAWAPQEAQPVTSVTWWQKGWLGGPYNNAIIYPTHWILCNAPGEGDG